MLATEVDQSFNDSDWLFEIKLDGFRCMAELHGKNVSIYSRNLVSFNKRFPLIVEDLKKLDLDAVLDGEIVALDEKKISKFQLLQNRDLKDPSFYYVFDLLAYQGKDLRHLSLIERKALLKSFLTKKSSICYLDHINDEGKKFYQLAKKQGLEGLIGKKKSSLYNSGLRSKEWVKIKIDKQQEFVICGFTEPRRSRKNFGALVIGVYKKNKLKYAGHVGGGFTEKKLEEVKTLLKPCITDACPFETVPKTNQPVTWVKPKYICQVKFKEWTKKGILRQPIFLGMRSDKTAKEVKKEMAVSIKSIEKDYSNLEKFPFLTNLDKIFWEKESITKGDVLQYYLSMSKYLLPYLKNRPQVLKRYPDGMRGESFYQKNLTSHPDWVKTVMIEHEKRSIEYLVADDVKTLLYAVNLGCIEIHAWFSRFQNLENPDFMVLDLDPEDISFEAVIETALTLHDILNDMEVPHYCKTSGSRGLHIAIPLGAKYTFEQAKYFAQLVALFAHEKLPKITSLERRPKNRQKKVYIDCFQNNFGQTLAVPYSLRVKPGAPVSTPLEWDELQQDISPGDFNLFNILDRVKKKGDLFMPVLHGKFNLKKALDKLQSH